MARSFEEEFRGNGPGQGPGGEPDRLPSGWSRQPGGFFSWVDGAPATGYRAPRQAPVATGCEVPVTLGPSRRSGSSRRPVTIITGEYGARVIGPLVSRLGRPDVGVLPVANRFFGGNIAVTGLLVGADVAAALADQPRGHRFLLPDVCLSKGVFLDGLGPADLPRPVEVIATEGSALRRALDL